MSIQLNQTASPYKGLTQFFEDEIGANRGYISDTAERYAKFVSAANQALDDFWAIAIPASGTWQLDDSGHTDYPIITTDLVSGQRDYSFTTDQQGNLILDIYRVFVKLSASSSIYQEIYPIDAQSDLGTEGFTDGQNLTGTPTHYDKTANGIFLDPVPSYASTNGLKIYINREASYFTTDSGHYTRKPGVPGILHRYFYLKPAAEYARQNILANADRLAAEVAKMEGVPGRAGTIEKYFARRERDIRHIMRPKKILFI